MGDAQLTALSLVRQCAAHTDHSDDAEVMQQMLDTYDEFRARRDDGGTQMLVGGLTLLATQLLHAVSEAWELDESAVLDLFTLTQHPDC